jgi:hypothetical protein
LVRKPALVEAVNRYPRVLGLRLPRYDSSLLFFLLGA